MLTTLLPLLLLVGVMFMMTRNAKRKQQQALSMRNNMAPGSGVRTIGGMYAVVKSINDDTVELEAAPGIFVHFAKNAIAAVLEPEEYAAIVHGAPASDEDVPPFVEDSEEAAEGAAEQAEDAPRLNLEKSTADEADAKVVEGTEGEGSAAK
ncbi:preprotein translocase subunit YajC [Peterkaempfera sp. SMS 1(5)a]|uniref:preprotein translocase subunit YajC n=1 Tax=Peterkaempfera podocarpi TaxID=3232308 RepID=UPI0036731A90